MCSSFILGVVHVSLVIITDGAVLLEKPVVAQLAQKLIAFYAIRALITVFTRARLLLLYESNAIVVR
jgi:hypothetical protein